MIDSQKKKTPPNSYRSLDGSSFTLIAFHMKRIQSRISNLKIETNKQKKKKNSKRQTHTYTHIRFYLF